MFTDTEIGLILRHRGELAEATNVGQGIINRQHAEILALRRQLAATTATAEELLEERGRRNAELVARRIARKTH